MFDLDVPVNTPKTASAVACDTSVSTLVIPANFDNFMKMNTYMMVEIHLNIKLMHHIIIYSSVSFLLKPVRKSNGIHCTGKTDTFYLLCQHPSLWSWNHFFQRCEIKFMFVINFQPTISTNFGLLWIYFQT